MKIPLLLKKSQAAIEFLVTYGWVILGVMMVVGALAYFGVFNTDNFVNDECSFGTQLYCEDFILSSTGNIRTTFRNNFGQQITVQNPVFIYDGTVLSPFCSILPSTVVNPGSKVDYSCTFGGVTFPVNEKIKLKVVMLFRRNLVGAPLHNVTGTIIATAQ